MNYEVSVAEKAHLRELANKVKEYAELPVMEERRELWYKHNALESDRPVIVVEMDTFEDDMFPAFKCESDAGKEMERRLLRSIINHELVDDDKVVEAEFIVPWQAEFKLFDLDVEKEVSKDEEGREVGYHEEHPLQDLEEDMEKLKPSTFSLDRNGSMAAKGLAEDVLGDILPVTMRNEAIQWLMTPTAEVISLMGMEDFFFALVDTPDESHELMKRIAADMMRCMNWMQDEGILTLNNGNVYAGSGSYGFTNELPAADFDGTVRPKDIWINMNSQESVGLSPDMFKEFIYPTYKELAKNFGMIYYGCCEPIHEVWDGCISELENLRKVSISPWCNEDIMGEALRGGKVIYSRKPSPNFLGVGDFDEAAYTEHITKSLKAAQGCTVELVQRDVYTINGDIAKVKRSTQICRELINKYWNV